MSAWTRTASRGSGGVGGGGGWGGMEVVGVGWAAAVSFLLWPARWDKGWLQLLGAGGWEGVNRVA